MSKRSGARRILVTGGAGFIGLHLAEALASDGANAITLVDDFSRGRRDHELEALLGRPNVALISADLTDPASYRDLGRGYDEIYHLAGKLGVANVIERPYQVIRGNAMATLLLLDWWLAGGGDRLLYASTSEAYAWTQSFYPLPVPTPESVPLALTDLTHPRASYAGVKMFGELAVIQAARTGRLNCAVVRYHNVYGPRMGFEHVIPELHARARRGENPMVVRSAHHVRAFCYVSDAVTASVAALRRANGQETFNIGNDAEPVTIGDLAQRLLRITGVNAKVVEAPPAANDPIAKRCPDISRARARLGFNPAIALDRGLAMTLAWYDAHLCEEARHAG